MSYYYKYSDFAKKRSFLLRRETGTGQGEGAGALIPAAPWASRGYLRANEAFSQRVGNGETQQGLAQAGVGRQGERG